MLHKAPSWIGYLFLFWVILLPKEFIAQNILDQEIRINLEKGSIIEFFDAIENEYGIVIAYSSNTLDLTRDIVLSKELLTLKDAFSAILEGQNLTPIERRNKILIVRNKTGDKEDDIFNYSGYILDAETNRPLIGATVHDPLSLKGVETNNDGFFSIDINEEIDHLVASFVGYQAQMLDPDPTTNRVSVALVPNPPIQEIFVSGSQEEDFNDFKRYEIDSESIEEQTTFFGDRDPIRSIKLLSGIQSGNEAQGGLYVRGAGTEHNLILLDGIPMYEINHAFNLSSIFNADAINNVSVYKNGIPARFGGRLASVVDITTKDGNYLENQHEVSLDLLGIRAKSEGPIARNTSSYHISGRVSLLDLYLDPFIKKYTDFEETQINFYDFNLKFNHKINPTSKLTLSAYFGNDKLEFENTKNSLGASDFEFENINRLRWRNNLLSLKWSHVISSKLFGTFSAGFSDYTYSPRSIYAYQTETNEGLEEFELDVFSRSRMRDLIFKYDVDYYNRNDNHFRFGAQLIRHSYQPFVRQSETRMGDDLDIIIGDENESFATELGIYIENDIEAGESFNLNYGLHLSGFVIPDKTYFNLEPRVYGNYMITENQSLFASFTSMSQYVHLLVNPGVGLPTDLWVPSTQNIGPERSYNFSLGMNSKSRGGFQFTLMAYYNFYDNILEYKTPVDIFYTIINRSITPPVFSESSEWQSRVEVGESKSKGIEIILSKQTERLNLYAAYTLSKTDRTFDNINDGNPFPYRYDRRHDLSLSSHLKLGKHFSLSGLFVFGTGNSFTLALEEFITIDGLPALNFEERNNFRLPEYHRLDLTLNFLKNYKNSTINASLGVQNIYNRNNPFYVYLFQDPTTEIVSLKQISIYPILPQFNLSYSF